MPLVCAHWVAPVPLPEVNARATSPALGPWFAPLISPWVGLELKQSLFQNRRDVFGSCPAPFIRPPQSLINSGCVSHWREVVGDGVFKKLRWCCIPVRQRLRPATWLQLLRHSAHGSGQASRPAIAAVGGPWP